MLCKFHLDKLCRQLLLRDQVSKSVKFHNRIGLNLRYYSQIAYFEALYIYLLPTWKHFIPVALEYDPAGHGVHTDPPVI